VLGDEAVKHAYDPQARQRGIDLGHQPRAAQLILDREDAEATAAVQHVRHEVEHPDVVRPLGRPERCPRAQCPLAATPPTYRKALLAVEPVDLLQVQDQNDRLAR
jgi:hypothetical protein